VLVSGLVRWPVGSFQLSFSPLAQIFSYATACECGAEEQTIDHAVLQCPIHRPPHGLQGLKVLDDETIEWLLNTCPEI